MIIDIYAHHISERVAKYVVKGKYYGEGKEFPFPPQNADPQARLALMDKYGVNIQALSQTTPLLLGWNPQEAAELCRMSNEDNFALCKAYPEEVREHLHHFSSGYAECHEGARPLRSTNSTAEGSRSPRARTAKGWSHASTILSMRRW